MNLFFPRGAACACTVLCFKLLLPNLAFTQQSAGSAEGSVAKFPSPEKLTYQLQWHSVDAGTAVVQLSKAAADHWQIGLNLQSAGVVTRLYPVTDSYKVITTDHFCTLSTFLDAQEGKRHRQTQLTFQPVQHKVNFFERNFTKNTTAKSELNVAPCTHDVISSLAILRALHLQPGKTATLPITDGKKLVYAKVEAQAKENVNINGKTYSAIRNEAFLFNNVLYKRKGRLLIWITDDALRLPVQMRVQLNFPIGTITLELEKVEQL